MLVISGLSYGLGSDLALGWRSELGISSFRFRSRSWSGFVLDYGS